MSRPADRGRASQADSCERNYFATYFWINKLKQIKQGLAPANLIHFGQGISLLGALYCGALLVIGGAKRPAANLFNHGLNLTPILVQLANDFARILHHRRK